MEANKIVLNKFIKGVNTDIAEDAIPEGFLSDGHNIKFTNDDNKQGIVQKQESYIKKLDGYGTNLKPLAARVFNDVIYIVSYIIGTSPPEVEYGTYPSADLTTRHTASNGKEMCDKVFVYAPLPNYLIIPLITTDPPIFYSVPGLNAPNQISTLTSNTTANWVFVSEDAGLGHSPGSGVSGSDITITVDDNYTTTPLTKILKVRSADGTETTDITIYQQLEPWIMSTPAVYNNIANSGAPSRSPIITTYTPTWEVTAYDAGINLIQSSGANGAQLIVTLDDNFAPPRTLEATVSTVEASPISTIVQFNQLGSSLGSVTTNSIGSIGYYSVQTFNEVTDDGDDPAGVRGICWNTTGTPTIGDDTLTSGTGEGAYEIVVTPLLPTTQYYLRAYFTNAIGTVYGP